MIKYINSSLINIWQDNLREIAKYKLIMQSKKIESFCEGTLPLQEAINQYLKLMDCNLITQAADMLNYLKRYVNGIDYSTIEKITVDYMRDPSNFDLCFEDKVEEGKVETEDFYDSAWEIDNIIKGIVDIKNIVMRSESLFDIYVSDEETQKEFKAYTEDKLIDLCPDEDESANYDEFISIFQENSTIILLKDYVMPEKYQILITKMLQISPQHIQGGIAAECFDYEGDTYISLSDSCLYEILDINVFILLICAMVDKER